MQDTQDTISIEIPLGKTAHQIAGNLAINYVKLEQSKQVYLNSLAVYAVHRYLQWFNIETDLNDSDCWNPATIGTRNIADLLIPKIGQLECRPIFPGETVLKIPEEIIEDATEFVGLEKKRIACLAVELDESLDYAHLRGFIRLIGSQQPSTGVSLDKLESIDSFFSYLGYIQDEFWLIPHTQNLATWVERSARPRDFNWQPSELLLTEGHCFSAPETIQQIKQLYQVSKNCHEFSQTIRLPNYTKELTLTVGYWEVSESEWAILFILRRTQNERFLPENLKIKLLSGDSLVPVSYQDVDDDNDKLIHVYGKAKMGNSIIFEISYKNRRCLSLPPFSFAKV
ncbi:MAG: DUF1822 family protein [Bacteroidota bacterium]